MMISPYEMGRDTCCVSAGTATLRPQHSQEQLQGAAPPSANTFPPKNPKRMNDVRRTSHQRHLDARAAKQQPHNFG
jgi:hypothetical protein